MQRRSYAKRLSNLSQSLQWDDGRWIWLTFILLTGALLLADGDSARLALRYDRTGLAHAQWWRLFSAHAVHLDARHFVLNALGLVLVWALFAREFRAAGWSLVVAGSALGVCAGLWWLDPAVQWYLGASGVLHGVMAAGCVRRIAERQWDRWLLSIALVTKLLWEQHGAHFDAAMPVIVDAHWLGALGGAAIAAALCARMAIIRR